MLALGVSIWLLALLPPRWRWVWGMGWLGGGAINLFWTTIVMDSAGWTYLKPVMYIILPLLFFERNVLWRKAIQSNSSATD